MSKFQYNILFCLRVVRQILMITVTIIQLKQEIQGGEALHLNYEQQRADEIRSLAAHTKAFGTNEVNMDE